MNTTRQNNPGKLRINARIAGLIIGGIGSVAAMGCSGSYLDSDAPTPRTPVSMTEGTNPDGEGYVKITDANGNEKNYYVPPTTETTNTTETEETNE